MTSENRAASMEEGAFAEISTLTAESAAPPAKPTFAGWMRARTPGNAQWTLTKAWALL